MTRGDHVPVQIVAEHAEGLLSEFEARRVSRHLSRCAQCRETVALLESVPRILAAADPGVMPACYVTRMNADLARLALREPVTPGLLVAPAPAVVPAGSQRQRPAARLRRMSPAAAALVLLVGGTALGIRSIGEHSAEPPAAYAAKVFEIPQDAVPDAHGNYVVPSTGTIYVPSAAGRSHGRNRRTADKVLRPDGLAIVRGPGGAATFLIPRHAVGPAQSATAGPRSKPPAVVGAATPTMSTGDPYVTRSGATYDPEHFAAEVMDLLSQAAARASTGAVQPSTDDDPADPAAAPDTAPDRATAVAPAPDLTAQVVRCAARVGRRALAGDEGLWDRRRATVVVVDSPDPDQVTGYVFYGRCAGSGPIPPRESPWAQQVDRPGAARPTMPVPAITSGPGAGHPEARAAGPTARPVAASDPALPDADGQK